MSTQGPTVDRTTVPGGAIIKLGGVINERFKADMLADVVQESVVIDLDGVRWITSIGVREWISAVSRIPAKELAFINCRPAMVLQFNMVHGFAGTGHIVSLYLPYACTECDEETEVLTDLRKQYDVVTEGPKDVIDCPLCGGRAEFDEIGFLSYVESQPKPIVPEVLGKLIDGDLDSLRSKATPFKIQKEITSELTAMWLSGPISYDIKLKRVVMGIEGTVVVAFDNVTEVDPRGIVRLESLLFPENGDVHLARVPPALLEALDPEKKRKLYGRVVSFALPVSCRACGRSDAIVSQIPEGGAGIVCPRCARQALVVVSQASIDRELSRFHEPHPPSVVVDYLAGRPHGPTIDRGGSSADRQSLLSRGISSQSAVRQPASIGKYQILRQIGSGGMAEVFLARYSGPQGFEKKVVIKKILPRLARDPVFVKMFTQEARLAARISHPNVVQVFELGDAGDEYFIAMEYVKGWSLDALLKALERRGQRFPVDLACRLCADICAGLQAAHTCGDDGGGIVHRDMSPHNVLVSEQGSVKIVDFGISKSSDTLGGDTKTGAIKGKVAYMAPEQIDKRFGHIDRRTDVLAAGLVLFEVLTGRSPHRRDTEFRTLMAALECDIPDVRTIRSEVPASIAAIVKRATQKSADDRYPTCRDFQLDLEDAIATTGRSGSSLHLASWLEAAALDAVKEGRLNLPGQSQTGAIDPDNETLLK